VGGCEFFTDRSLRQLVTAMASFDTSSSVEEVESHPAHHNVREHEFSGASSRQAMRWNQPGPDVNTLPGRREPVRRPLISDQKDRLVRKA
jgi:hypothetical protein